MSSTKLFIADDHQLIRDGLESLISGINGFELCGKACSGEELIDTLMKTKELPQVCVIDIEMPGMGGLATMKVVKEKFPLVKVIVLTMHEESFYFNRAVREGADAYLSKNINREVFADCVHKVMKGEVFSGIETGQASSANPSENKSIDALTMRETHILKLVAQGKTNKQIASELFISKRTVDTHRNNLMRKLKISSSVQLVHYAYSNNLV
ncbi:DNA-binding response regulator [Cytophagales bacterium WSM2-2]|nr:DNA-binding response regulator [Cytophagales bacterium WSM2-2]